MGSEADKALDDILAAYGEFEDEEVIQFVDVASSLGRTDWLLSRLEALRAHVTYMPTLLFEIAVMLEIEQRYSEAITLLEELTDLEPYNEQYWFMLAQEYDLNATSPEHFRLLISLSPSCPTTKPCVSIMPVFLPATRSAVSRP